MKPSISEPETRPYRELLPIGDSHHAARNRETSPRGTWRILAPGLAAWLMSAWGITNPGVGVWFVGGAAALGIMLLTAALRVAAIRQSAGVLLLGCAVFLILGVRIIDGETARSNVTLSKAATDSMFLDFDAELRGFPKRQASATTHTPNVHSDSKPGTGERFWVRAAAITSTGHVPLLLWLNEEPPDHWAPGTRIQAAGVPKRLDPGDSAAFSVAVRQLSEAGTQTWSAGITAIAGHIRVELRHIAESIPGAELVPGFAVGDTSLVPEAIKQDMRNSSLSHVTAVSGANCALVIGAVMWMLARSGVGRRGRTIAAGMALLGFVVLVGPDASVQRAALMATVMLVSGFGGKRSVALPALGIAVTVLLISDPWQSIEAGFVLSVVATGGIIIAANPCAKWLRRRAHLPQLVALPIAVSAVAQFACGPFLLLLQPGIPIAGVFANTLAAPAIPVGTGLGLLAALTVLWNPTLSSFLVWSAGFSTRWVSDVATITSEWPLSRWYWPDGWWGFTLLMGCQLLLLVAWALHRGFVAFDRLSHQIPRQPWKVSSQRPAKLRASIAALTALALGIGTATIVVTPAVTRLVTPSGWIAVACDVGQGDAMLLRHERRPESVMLIDTGNDAELLLRCLNMFGVDRISLLVLSHDDVDHVGALHAIVSRVDAVLVAPRAAGQTQEERPVLRELEDFGVPYTVGSAGLHSLNQDTAEGLTWEVLAPQPATTPITTNAASLVVSVRLGTTNVLLLGDTGRSEQIGLLREFPSIEATIVKVAHHGSQDQYPELYSRIRAQWALISVGSANRYGHPSPDTLRNLTSSETQVFRTDQHGAIALIQGDEDELHAWMERVDVGWKP